MLSILSKPMLLVVSSEMVAREFFFFNESRNKRNNIFIGIE